MKKITIALLTALMLAGAGCTSEKPEPEPNKEGPNPDKPWVEPQEPVATPHYVLGYANCTKFEATVYPEKPVIALKGDYDELYSWLDRPSRPNDPSPYIALCNKNNDFTYNRERMINLYQSGYDYPASSFVEIHIVSDKDYDAAHPAGSSLNDLCILASASPRKHIASRYTETFDWMNDLPEIFASSSAFSIYTPTGNIPIQKLLSECTADDMVLMGSGFIEAICELHFTKRPDAGLKQRFTVTLKDEAGKTFTTTTREVEW